MTKLKEEKIVNEERPAMKMSEQECRELDAWICQHVFGWVPHVIIASGRIQWYGRNPVNGGLTACPPWDVPPHYSTDPAASMELLRKLVFQHEIFLSKTLDGQFLIAVDDGDKFNEQLSATAPTLELAIALLAQKLHAEKTR